MDFTFTEENLEKIKQEVKKYPEPKPAVMKALYLGQEQNGWVSLEVIKAVAAALGISEEEVMGVATFYTMYHKKPAGKYHLQVCTCVSCMLREGYEIFDLIREKTGLENGQTDAEGRFSLEECECLGSCGTAPMMAVNDTFHENLTKEKVIELLDSLK
jgi:NADH-quinone oxidoreductase E subunit